MRKLPDNEYLILDYKNDTLYTQSPVDTLQQVVITLFRHKLIVLFYEAIQMHI